MRIIYTVCAVVLVAILATVGAVVVQQRQQAAARAEREAKAQVNPPHLSSDGAALVVNPRTTGDVPTVRIYLDFQCPYCKQFNDSYGAVLNQLAGAGEIHLEYSVLTVIGKALGNEDASERAGRAAMCADIAGVLPTYHDAVFNGQPAKEGDGFTDEQLRVTFANEAGLQGADLTKFQQCYDSSATSRALRVEQEKAMPTFGGTTPQVTVNGKNPTVTGTDGKQQAWWQGVEPSVQAWEAAIKQYS